MRTVQTKIYEFAELSETARERARNWYRQTGISCEWWDGIFEDAERVGLKITSFGLGRNRHCKGSFINSATECADRITKEHGRVCETFKTAEAFLKERGHIIVDTAEKDESELEAKLNALELAFLQSILKDYSIILQAEYDYLMSDSSVDESIVANKYEFTEVGMHFDGGIVVQNF